MYRYSRQIRQRLHTAAKDNNWAEKYNILIEGANEMVRLVVRWESCFIIRSWFLTEMCLR